MSGSSSPDLAVLVPASHGPTEVRATRPRRSGRRAGSGLAIWSAVVGAGLAVGTLAVARWPAAGLGAAPFDGHWGWRLGPSLLPAAAVAAAAVTWAPELSQRLRWPGLVVTAGGATLAWAAALAVSDGGARLASPLAGRHDYLAVVGRIGSPQAFLDTYTERLGTYPVHVQGHPPGMPLVLWALDRLGFGGPGWAAALTLAGAALASASVLMAVRSVAGEEAARAAAPFVALAPAALWYATSADALFAGIAALGCTLLVAGRNRAEHLAGGVVLGLALHLSYGILPLLAIPGAVALGRRDPGPVRGSVLGIGAITVAFALAGFWWFDGLAATRHLYETGIARYRPYGVFTLLVNPAALALAVGPAAAAGLTLSRHHRALLPVAALAAVATADVSGLSKGEVERIWLPFVPWLLAGTAALPAGQRRRWLAAQTGVALILQAALRSPW